VVDTDERLLTGTPETAGSGSDGETTVGAVPMAWLTGGGMSAPTDRGDMLVIRIGAIASACRIAAQNSPAVCQRSAGLVATAFLSAASTSSLTSAPSVRGVGRRSGFAEATASWT
jgi:hypothetical protein